ncbi:glycosyltransferase [Paenibacillus sp. M1]|uniref:Glycosyltransferase n=1 Tax=Paenibacillus haidiansis TaxID=1574488 RepID=A0ABU7VSU7_9BACL
MKKATSRFPKRNTRSGTPILLNPLGSRGPERTHRITNHSANPSSSPLLAGAGELFPPRPEAASPSAIPYGLLKEHKRANEYSQAGAAGLKPGTYDVFRFPVIDWDFRWQRPQQISRQFADHGQRVFYVTTEMTALTRDGLSKDEVIRYVKVQKAAPQVWLVTLCSNRKLNLYQDEMSPEDVRFLQWSIEHVKAKFHITHMLSIVDLPFWAPLVEALDNNKVIYDCMDDHSGFSTNSPSMLLQEERLISISDLVLASSQSLYDKLRKLHPAVVLLRNGADVEHFRSPNGKSVPELAGIEGPIIGYFGAISEWFDIGLIHGLALRRPDWTFILIGNTFGCDISEVEGLDNVKLLGEKPYGELPEYLHRFDAALIPFKYNELTKATNPVKLYEYLAAGKPVIASPLPELAAVAPHLISMAYGPEQFEAAIGQALKFTTPGKAKRMAEFASANSWKQRFDELQTAIAQRIFPKVSVILVTHNNWSYTQQCLRSLLRPGQYPNLETIVVDNASGDQTLEQLGKISDDRLKVISLDRNLGFAAGNTAGCESAGGEYLILLNNDTIIPDGSWISRLIRPLMKHPDVGMAGPMSNFVGNDQALDHFVGDRSAGPNPNWLEDFYFYYKGKCRETELLGFFCVAMKRKVWETVGPLDSNYGLGMFEDDDYCERVKRAGYRLMIVEDAFVYHHGSATIKKMQPDEYETLWSQNKAYFEQKWMKIWRNPKRPENLFFGAEDPADAAGRLEASGRGTVLVLGGKNWTANRSRWQTIVRELASEQSRLIIVPVLRHYNHPVAGIRKAGPQLYLTNRIDLFAEAKFDAVIYCGDAAPPPLRAGRHIADTGSYTAGQLEVLGRVVPQLEYWSGGDPAAIVQEIGRSPSFADNLQ